MVNALQGPRSSRNSENPFRRTEGTALGRDRRGVFQLDEPARHQLPPHPQYPAIMGQGRQRPGDERSAIWADTFGDGRGVHAQPLDPARRRSTASSWSMLKGKTWWPASARRKTSRRKARIEAGSDKPSLEKLMPGRLSRTCGIGRPAGSHYRDMQDLPEFTSSRGKLWMLQTPRASAPRRQRS